MAQKKSPLIHTRIKQKRSFRKLWKVTLRERIAKSTKTQSPKDVNSRRTPEAALVVAIAPTRRYGVICNLVMRLCHKDHNRTRSSEDWI